MTKIWFVLFLRMRRTEESPHFFSGHVLPAVCAGCAHVHGGRSLPLPVDGLLLCLRDGAALGLLLPDHRHWLVLRH